MTWREALRQEFKRIFLRDPRRAAFLLGSAVTYLVLFGLLYGTHVINAVPLVVYDEDQTGMSRAMVQRFEDSERFRVIGYVSSQEEMEKLLRDREAYAAVNIPARFARDVKTGLSSQVLLMVNGGNLAVANVVVTSGQEIVAGFARETGAAMLEKSGPLPAQAAGKVSPVDYRLRVLHNPTLSYSNYFLLGLAMAALQAGTLLAVGAAMMDEFRRPRRTEGTGVYRFLAQKLAPYWLCAVGSFAVTLGIAGSVFGVSAKGNVLLLLPLGIAFTFAVAAMGGLLAAYCRSEASYTQAVLAYAVPAFVLSGYIWPLAGMEPISRLLSYGVPLTYMAESIRGIMLAGYAPQYCRDVGALAVFGAVSFWLMARAVERRRGASSREEGSVLSK